MSKTRNSDALYFTGIALVDKDEVILTGNYYALEDADENKTAVISLKHGKWGWLNLGGIAYAVGVKGQPGDTDRPFLILERNRVLYRVRPPKNVKYEMINEEREGFLMDIREIEGKLYAVGGHHQIYQESDDIWKPIDDGVYIPGEEGQARILLSIDGTSGSDIYTVGFNGIILHYDGQSWEQLDSPTNLGIQRVLCVNEAEVYFCGYGNQLYKGNKKGWLPLTEPEDDIAYWDMAYFQGNVYVCTMDKLFIIKDEQLEEVYIPVKGPLGFYRMSCDDSQLWTCGDECLLKFDGRDWKQYIFPSNT